MTLGQFEDILDMASKHQVIATHDKLIGIDGYRHSVKVVHLNQSTSLHVHQACIT